MRYLKGATWYLAKGTVNKFVISPTLQNYPHSKFLCVQSFTSCWLPLTFVRPCLPPWPCFPAVLHMCHLLSQFLNGIRLLLTSGPFAHAAPAARNTSSFTPAPTTDPLLVNSCPKLRSFLDLPSLIPKKTRPPGHVLSQHPLPPCCATQHHNNHRITSVICCKHFSLLSDKFHEVGSPAALFIALSLAHSTGPSS